MLETAAPYFEKAPARADVLSAFAGIRPLVARSGTASTASLSRDHTIRVEAVAAGDDHRRQMDDLPAHGRGRGRRRRCRLRGLPQRACVTRTLRVHGWDPQAEPTRRAGASTAATPRNSRRSCVRTPDWASRCTRVCRAPVPTVTWAARAEMARTVEDVLARRCRALFLDAGAARAMAPQVAAILARELGRDAAWERQQVAEFTALAGRYVVGGAGGATP